MNKGILIVVGIFLSVILAGAYFLSSPRNSSLKNSTPAPANNSAVTPTGNVKEFDITADEYSFSPTSISVSKGDTVKINFKNNGNFTHNYIIDELGLETRNVPKGGTDMIEFVADKEGTFTYYCSIDSHANLGMKGELEVK